MLIELVSLVCEVKVWYSVNVVFLSGVVMLVFILLLVVNVFSVVVNLVGDVLMVW